MSTYFSRQLGSNQYNLAKLLVRILTYIELYNLLESLHHQQRCLLHHWVAVLQNKQKRRI